MWRHGLRSGLSLLCSELLLLNTLSCGGHRVTLPEVRAPKEVFDPLQEELKKSYATLFEIAPTLEYSGSQITTMQGYLKQAQDYCTGRFEAVAKDYDRQVDTDQSGLKKSIPDEERHNLHCRIQESRSLKNQADIIAHQSIPVAYENKLAKLELIGKWPAEQSQIRQSILDGSYKTRRWGDVQDIGFREIEKNQKDDIKMGQEAIQDLKRTGLMPKEVENKVVVDYVRRVGQKVAANSDLQVPLVITVLDSKEINAFAMPGGFLFIERGLLDAVDDESQLAGVIAHEISHDVARHGRKLMKRATIASLIYQAAQVAAVIFTGGAVGIGTYYAMQYGFYGLGLTLNLSLLGVSRDFEREADLLGVQYSWKAGYDPAGYINFFDKMATKEGYINGTSWFRTHPAFYERMVSSERELMYLPKHDSPTVTTSEFLVMKEALAGVTAAAELESSQKPSLLAPEQGCAVAGKLLYEPNQPIEAICATPQVKPEVKVARF